MIQKISDATQSVASELVTQECTDLRAQSRQVQPCVELPHNPRRTKARVRYHILPPVPGEGEAGSNAATVARELDASLPGTFPVISSSVFSLCPHNVRMEMVGEKKEIKMSLLVFASAES